MIKSRRIGGLLFSLLFLCAIAIGNTRVSVSAEEGFSSQAEEILESTMFITFRKGDTSSYGKFIFSCYYVPNTVYDSACQASAIILPTVYLTQNGITDNYLENLTEKKVAHLHIQAQYPIATPEGNIYKFGLTNILERNLSVEFAFIFSILDSNGVRKYYAPKYTEYNTLQAENYSDAELIEMVNARLQTQKSFEGIVYKIEELVDSVWIYLIIAVSAVIVLWGVYIGIVIVIAKKNEHQINAKRMCKRLVIGMVVMFILAFGVPLLIHGLAAWV